MIIANSERIYIRQFRQTDTNAVYLYRSLKEVAKYQYWEPFTKEQILAFIEQCKDSDINIEEKWNGFAIVLQEDNILIGDCSIKINKDTAEIGCNISPAYQNRGHAKETLSLLLNVCFNKIDVNQVYGITDSENAASIKLMESLGMTRVLDFEEKCICKGLPCIEYKYLIKKNKNSEK